MTIDPTVVSVDEVGRSRRGLRMKGDAGQAAAQEQNDQII